MSATNATGPDPAAARKLRENPTRSYRPGASWSAGLATAGMDGTPWFTWMDVPRMLRDPRVRFLERMWRSPFQRAKFKIVSDDPRVARYAGRTLRKFWSGSLPRLLSRYFRFGFGCGGAEFVAARGKVHLDQVRVVEALDARPLAWADGPDKGLPAGFAAPGVARVLAPHAVWFAGQAEVSPWYDMPPISGAFEPWSEKRGRNGAVASRRLWYWKNAVRGGGLYYPPGRSNIGTEETPQWIDNQDLARQVMDYTENGSTMIFENTQHGGLEGKRAWEYTAPESFPDRAGLLDYPGHLDKEMAEGVGIPPEVLEASEVGSGWSGRMVPMETWLGGVDEFVGLAYKAFEPTLKYAVAANYGRGAFFDVEPQSLVEMVRQQAQAGPGGGEGKNPVPGLLGKGGDEGGGDEGGGDEPKPQKLSGGWEPYNRRNGKKGLRNPVTHRYREMSGSGRVPKHVRRKVKKLLAARDLSDGRAGGQHAPKGGVTIGGTTYPGGRFIPGEVIDKATPAEKAALDGKGSGGDKSERLPARAVALAGRVLAKGAAAAGKAEHVLVNVILANHARLPAGLRGATAAAFRLGMAGFDAGQAAAQAAALDRGVAPERVAKIGHLLAIADVAMFKGAKAAALLGVPGGAAALWVTGSVPVASLAYLAYSSAANPIRTAKAALKAVKAALAQTGRNVKDDAKSIPSDLMASVKKLAAKAGVGSPALALSDGRGDGEGLEDLMAELADADPGRADWLVACFAAALAETDGDGDAAAELAVQAAGDGDDTGGGGKLLSAAEFGPTHAGLCVRAADTGRVLMLQRAATPGDPAAGMWEFPGGKIEAGESPLRAASREWAEEVGAQLPPGRYVGEWASGNGVYAGHVWELPTEAAVDIAGRAGDRGEAVAWRAPADLRGADIRAELRADAAKVQAAVGAAGPARELSDDRGGARHAPKGGVTIGGTTYPGGSFIPAEVVESATAAEKAALDGGPKPAPAPGKDGPAWKSHPAAGVVAKAVAASPGLSDEQRATYGAAATRVLGRMPPKALDRLHAHVSTMTFHPTNEAVGEALLASYGGSAAGSAFAERVRKMIADGMAPAGAYSTQTGAVHADGGFPAGSGGWMVSKSLPEATPAHIYAHEWGHAIDGPTFELSASPAWQEACAAEFKNGRLTEYASFKPSEAWAEFARAVYAADVPLDRVEAAFPKASAVWKEAGLWPV